MTENEQPHLVNAPSMICIRCGKPKDGRCHYCKNGPFCSKKCCYSNVVCHKTSCSWFAEQPNVTVISATTTTTTTATTTTTTTTAAAAAAFTKDTRRAKLQEISSDKLRREELCNMYLEGLHKLRQMCILLGASEDTIILPVGSVPKGTGTAASDFDAKVIITHFERDGSYCEFNESDAVFECARRLRKRKYVTIGRSWSITYQSHNPIHRLRMKLLVVILKHTKKDGSELSVSVDLQGCNDESSVRNTLWVRSVTLGNELIPQAIVVIKRLSSILNWSLKGYGLELLVLVALVRLQKIPITDPLFRYSVPGLSSLQDLGVYDAFHAGDMLNALKPEAFAMFTVLGFTLLEVLEQIDRMLAGKCPVVIRLQESDVMPEVDGHSLVIVDPCVLPSVPSCLGKNAAHTVSDDGLRKIRLGVKNCIASLK